MSELNDFFKFLFEELLVSGGEEKNLYCTEESKGTKHMGINYDDVIKIKDKRGKYNQFDKFIINLPGLMGFTKLIARPFTGKPFICESCGNIKWE